MDLVFQLHFRPNLRMKIDLDFVNLNVSKCFGESEITIIEGCRILWFRIENQRKQDKKLYTIYRVFSGKVVGFFC